MPALISMCFDKWFENFKPLVNPNSDGSGLCIDEYCYMYETYGHDLEKVLKVVNSSTEETHIWTLIEGDDGYHLVNRQGYFITLNPVPTGSSYEVAYDDEQDSET